jgi:hypothetical protein
MVTRAYQLWATYSWAGPLFVYSGRDQGHDNSSDNDWYGLLQANWVPKPSFDAYWAVSHALALAVHNARR